MKKTIFTLIYLSALSVIQAQSYLSHFSLEGLSRDPIAFEYDFLANSNVIIPSIIDTDAYFFPGAVSIYQETPIKNPGSLLTCVSNNNVLHGLKNGYQKII
jgi:hypothetical protein